MRVLFIMFVLALLAAPASAGPVVLEVKGDSVLVELGAADGVGAGSVLELLHEVTVRDPVTQETLRDVFPIGELTVIRAGDGVAEARPDDTVKGRVKTGDAVRLLSAKKKFADPWAVKTRSKTPAPVPGRDGEAVESKGGTLSSAEAQRKIEDAAAVRAVWEQTLGRALSERIDLWEALLAADADNGYANAVRDEIATLRAQQTAIDAAIAAPPADRAAALSAALAGLDDRARGPGALAAASIARARLGEPIALAFAIRDDAAASLGWLYARTRGDDGFQRFELRADGDGYLRGEIPGALVAPPGVEWFVETADRDGEPAAAIGSQGAPQRIVVDDVREPEVAPRGRSRVTMALDYVDFDGGLRDGFDQYTQAELDFMYRFQRPAVYAFRLGFGTLVGTGGPKDVIDEDPTNSCQENDGTGAYRCRDVSFTYGYVETETRIRPNLSLMLRPQIGRLTVSESEVADPDDCLAAELEDGCSVGKAYGFRARVRLGEETATNLVVGLAATSNVGTVFEAAYTWVAQPALPVVLAVQVTDLPVAENLGVRIVGDVGWRRVSWVYPSLRLSYQARDVDHAGFSGGLGLNFDW
jgi:hypothetical protein